MRLLFRCVPLLKPVAWHLAALVGIGVALALAAAYPGIQIVNVFWNSVLEGNPLSWIQARLLFVDAALVTDPALYGAEERRLVLRHVVVAGLVMFAVLAPAGLALYYYRIWILQRVNHLLRLRLVDRFQALSLRFHADSRVGDAIYRMYQDRAMVTQVIDVMVLTPLDTLGRFFFSLALVSLWDPWLAGVLALGWPAMLVLGRVFSRPLRIDFRRAREANSRLTSRIQETLVGIKVVKAYGAELLEQDRFEDASLRAFAAAYAARVIATPSPKPAMRQCVRPHASPAPTSSSRSCPTATTRCSGSGGASSRRDSDNGFRSRAPCSRTRRFWSWTSRPRRSIPTPSSASSPLCAWLTDNGS
jgi:ATP-binding cassette subfamily B protein